MRRYSFVLAAIVAGCGGSGTTSVTTTSTPPTAGGSDGGGGNGGGAPDGGGMPGGGGGSGGGGVDGGMPGGGGGGGGGPGACADTKPVAVATAEKFAAALAVDDTDVYFTTQATQYDAWNLWRAPIGGGAAIEVGTTGESSMGIYVTVNATAVFTLNGDGQLLRWPKSGGAPLQMSARQTNVAVNCLADAFGYVYTCNDDAGDDQIVRRPEDGGPSSFVLANKVIMGVAFDPTHLWIDTPHGTFGGPPDGQTGSTISLPPTSAAPGPIAVDDAHVFVGTLDGHVVVADKRDGAPFAPFADTLQYPNELRVYDGNLYVRSSESDAQGAHVIITRYPVTDGTHATTLVDLHGSIGAMAVRGDYVYYTSPSDSTVYRVCK